MGIRQDGWIRQVWVQDGDKTDRMGIRQVRVIGWG